MRAISYIHLPGDLKALNLSFCIVYTHSSKIRVLENIDSNRRSHHLPPPPLSWRIYRRFLCKHCRLCIANTYYIQYADIVTVYKHGYLYLIAHCQPGHFGYKKNWLVRIYSIYYIGDSCVKTIDCVQPLANAYLHTLTYVVTEQCQTSLSYNMHRVDCVQCTVLYVYLHLYIHS